MRVTLLLSPALGGVCLQESFLDRVVGKWYFHGVSRYSGVDLCFLEMIDEDGCTTQSARGDTTWTPTSVCDMLLVSPNTTGAAFRTRTSVSSSLTKSHRIRFECWRTACRQLFTAEIEAANATLQGVSLSSVTAHVELRSLFWQGTTGSLECAFAGSLQHSALSRAPSAPQVSSRVHQVEWISLSAAPLLRAFGDSAATKVQVRSRYGRQPAFRATVSIHWVGESLGKVLVIKEPVTVHVRRPPDCPLRGTDSMLQKALRSVFVIVRLLSHDAVTPKWPSMKWKTLKSHHLPISPPFAANRMWDGAQVG